MILDIYKDAFEYSAKDWKALIVLGVMCLFSFLIIPAFLIAGYGYRVENIAVHGIINGNDPLPEFDDIFEMFIEGVKVFLVQIQINKVKGGKQESEYFVYLKKDIEEILSDIETKKIKSEKI